MNCFNVKKWCDRLKLFIETDIQIIYFLEENYFNKKKINKSIKKNVNEILEIEKIIQKSPTNLKDSQSKAWEIKQNDNNNNPLNDLINKQIINIYNDFSGLTQDDQEKVLKHTKNNKYHVNILSQILRKENELSKTVQSRLVKLQSEKNN